jgi:hypothetical protein
MPSGTYGNAVCVVVARPSVATLKLINGTHLTLVSAVLNGGEVLAAPGLAPGQSVPIIFQGQGQVQYRLGAGFFGAGSGTPTILYSTPTAGTVTPMGTITVAFGQTTNMTYSLTLPDVLADSKAFADWCGTDIFVTGLPRCFRFYRNGAWEFYNNGKFDSSGVVTDVVWLDGSIVPTFKVCADTRCIGRMNLLDKYFRMHNTADGSEVEYTPQP